MQDNRDKRQQAAATERNRQPILAVLQQVLPPGGCVLEIASGTGQHACYLAPLLQPRCWLPSDPNPEARESIQAWRQDCPSDNLLPPLDLDAADPAWPDQIRELAPDLNAIVNINMVHISPWSCCLGLLAGARRSLPVGGVLYLYGPFKRGGQHTAPSNQAFDEFLKAQNPAWGVRDLEAVIEAASAQALNLQTVVEMPANNLSVVFCRV